MSKEKPLVQLTVKLTDEKEKQVKRYANKYHNGNVAMALREFIDKGLAINSYKEDITFLRQMINEELESVIDPKLERIIALQVKGSVMSAGSFFLNAKSIEKFVPPTLRVDLKENIEQAKKMGGVYLKGKDFSIDEIIDKFGGGSN